MSREGVVLFALLALAALSSPAGARRSFGGGGRHSYPGSRTGLSGTHTAPKAVPVHSYPAGGGLSGSHSQPKGHSYPPSSGLSGSSGGGHSYPSSGLSGQPRPVYSPPQQIHYAPSHGAPPQPYPVYHGPPPVYVTQYRDSGSPFGTLLTGLALYNLGRMALHGNSDSKPRDDAPGERCALRIEQDRNLTVVKIPCYIVSTLTDINTGNKSATNVTTASPNVTATLSPSNSTNQTETTTASASVPVILANATADNSTTVNVTETTAENSTGPTLEMTSTDKVSLDNATAVNGSTTVTPPSTEVPVTTVAAVTTTVATANTTQVVDPLQTKGEPVKLNNGTRCFVERETKSTKTRKEVDCGLLQQYALQSYQKKQDSRSSATYHVSQAVLVVISCIVLIN